MTKQNVKPGIPALFYDEVTLASGKAVLPDLSKLRPKTRAPMEIDEVFFTVRSPPMDMLKNHNMGGIVRVALRLKTHALTNGFIPIWNLCPAYQDSVEFQMGGIGFVTTGKGYVYSHYRWVLPVPLFVEPGAVLTPSFLRSSDWDAAHAGGVYDPALGAMKVRVTYAGRVLSCSDPMPSRLRLPYVAAWTPPVGQLVSGENDLKNVLETDVRVQRLIGRVMSYRGDAADPACDELSSVNFADTNIVARQLELTDQHGYQITSGRVPWVGLFPPQRRAWTFNWMLKPRERLVARLADAPHLSEYMPMISLVGVWEA